MIARNFIKYPQALALQFPLPWGTALTWHTERPGSRLLRKIRAARHKAFLAAGRIKQPTKTKTPAWWKQWKHKARSLAAKVRNACQVLWAEVRVAVTTADTTLIGFNYAGTAQCFACGWTELRTIPFHNLRTHIQCTRCEASWPPERTEEQWHMHIELQDDDEK